MSDTFTLEAFWGDWHFTTTESSLNGQIDCEGIHKGGNKETLHLILED